MSRKILLFSRDPGGANTIIPLVRPLLDKGYDVQLFGKDASLHKFEKAGLPVCNITDFISDISVNAMMEFLESHSPDFIITGTSSDLSERYLWKAGESLAIPSFAIIDQWINYGIRFSRYTLTEIDSYKKDASHPYLPSKIMVMDNYAKKEAVRDGLASARILVTGQPYFETIRSEGKHISLEKTRALRESLGIDEEDFLITFASEPVTKDYGKATGYDNYMGYTEKTILKELLDGLDKISPQYNGGISLVIRLHPREDGNDVLASKRGKVNIVVDRNTKPSDLIMASDLVCGMSSMFLIESVIIGKPVISILIGLSIENPLILDKRNIVKSCTSKEMLLSQLKSAVIERSLTIGKFDFLENSVNNIIMQMEKHLCLN